MFLIECRFTETNDPSCHVPCGQNPKPCLKIAEVQEHGDGGRRDKGNPGSPRCDGHWEESQTRGCSPGTVGTVAPVEGLSLGSSQGGPWGQAEAHKSPPPQVVMLWVSCDA